MPAGPYRIERLLIPDGLDSPAAADFLGVGELCDALTLQTWGNLDRATPPAARLQFWRDNDYRQVELFFVRQDGRMVGRSWVRCEVLENLRSAMVHVDVLEEFSGRGIGQALLRHAQGLAAAAGRTILQSYTEHPSGFDRDTVVRPATGAGAVPAGARGVRFALKAGYRLEQVSRFSALDVPAHAASWDALERQAVARAGDDYELLSWTGSCPDEHAGQFAVLMSRTNTDAPTGDSSNSATSAACSPSTRRWNGSSRSTPRRTATCSPSTWRSDSGPPATTANGSGPSTPATGRSRPAHVVDGTPAQTGIC